MKKIEISFIKFLFGCFLLLAIIPLNTQCQIEKDDWEIKSPQDLGLDQNLLLEFKTELESGSFGNTHEVLIVKEGYLVFEHYFEGHKIDDLHYTASVSKSIGSIVFGMAMDHGFIPDLSSGITQKPISDLLPAYNDIFIGQKSDILLHHVLNMTANLEWDENSFPYNDARNDWYNASIATEPVKYAFSRESIGKPGERFEYNGGMSVTLSYIVDKAQNTKTIKFAEKELFHPLGIENYQWRELRYGLLDFDGGLYMRPRDMAKIGQLMLNDGVWKGKQIVSRQWVEVSTKMHIEIINSPDYGYQWWGGRYSFYENSCSLFMASGHGGQLIVVIPEFDMVVVITQQVFDNPMGHFNTIGLLTKYILPSVKTSGVITQQLNRPDLEKRVGTYYSPQGQMEIKLIDDSLHAKGDSDETEMVLTPLSNNQFVGEVMGVLPVFLEFRDDKCFARFGFQEQEYLRQH